MWDTDYLDCYILARYTLFLVAATNGLRAASIKWTEIDEERRIIILNNPEKGSSTCGKSQQNFAKRLAKKTQYIFENPNPRAIRALFCNAYRSLAENSKTRLLKISFDTFRQ